MKSDERLFLAKIVEANSIPRNQRPLADAIGISLGIHPKRVNYILNKWASKRWWNYGVSVRTGWLEPKGLEAATRLLAKVRS